jgi:hypothetical protein
MRLDIICGNVNYNNRFVHYRLWNLSTKQLVIITSWWIIASKAAAGVTLDQRTLSSLAYLCPDISWWIVPLCMWDRRTDGRTGVVDGWGASAVIGECRVFGQTQSWQIEPLILWTWPFGTIFTRQHRWASRGPSGLLGQKKTLFSISVFSSVVKHCPLWPFSSSSTATAHSTNSTECLGLCVDLAQVSLYP